MKNIAEMQQFEVEQALMEIAARLLKIDISTISPDSRLEVDLPFDSLEVEAYYTEIEAEFGIYVAAYVHEEVFNGRPTTIRSLAGSMIRNPEPKRK